MAYGMALTHCAGLSGGLARATRCTLRQAVLTTRPVFTRQTKGLRPSSRPLTVTPRAMAVDMIAAIKEKNDSNPVMVYSKTYCPYCAEVKALFERLNVKAKVVDLDSLADGTAVQQALATLTGRRTVPQVFIGGQHLGGCDDTMEAYDSGRLKQLLHKAGVEI